MARDKSINFGHYTRWKYLSKGWSLKEFAQKLKMSDRRVLQIVKHYPDSNLLPEGTVYRIAKAFEMDLDVMEEEWRSTPVVAPRMRDTRAKVAGKIPGVHSGEKIKHRKAAKGTER